MNRRTLLKACTSLPLLPQAISAQTPQASPIATSANRRVIAGSESATSGELESDALFGTWVGEGNKALYLAIASEDDDARTPLKTERVWNTISASGVSDLDIWLNVDVEADGFVPDLSDYSGVYIGDGNPGRLLERLHASGLFQALADACNQGSVLYGTSSGCMVLGIDLALSAFGQRAVERDMPQEERDGLNVIQAEDGTPLVLVPHAPPTASSVWKEVATETGYRVALIQDGSAITLNEGVLEEIGEDPISWIEAA